MRTRPRRTAGLSMFEREGAALENLDDMDNAIDFPVATQPAVPFSLKNPVGWPTFTRVSVAKSESSMRDGSEGGHFAISA